MPKIPVTTVIGRVDPSDLFNVKSRTGTRVQPVSEGIGPSLMATDASAAEAKITSSLASFLGLASLPAGLSAVVKNLSLSSFEGVAYAMETAAETAALMGLIKTLFGLKEEREVNDKLIWLLIAANKRISELEYMELPKVSDSRLPQYFGVTVKDAEYLQSIFENATITRETYRRVNDVTLPFWKRAAYSVALLRGTEGGSKSIEKLGIRLAESIEANSGLVSFRNQFSQQLLLTETHIQL